MPVYPLAARNARCAPPGCWCRDRSARYRSDLDDSQWRVLEPEARAVMAQLTRASGRPMARATVLIMTRRLARYQADQLPEPRWGGDCKPPRPEQQAAESP